MDYSEECRSYILPPAEEVDLYTEDTGCLDQRWGPLNDEDISLLLRRINFKEIIALHTKNIKHTLQKCESVNKKLQNTVTVLQGELEATKTTCETQQVRIEELQKKLEESHNVERLEIMETKIKELQDEEEVSNGDDGERLHTIEIKVEELKVEEARQSERMDTIETKMEELVSENEGYLQVSQHQDIFTREFKEVEKNIIIKNLPMVSSEDQKDTTNMVKDIFKQVSLPSSVKFSAKRILNTKKDSKPGRNGRKGWPPIIQVTFKSSDTKTELFQQLKNLKGSIYEKLSIQNEVPPCCRKQVKLAEVKAAEHRKKNPTTKTKVSLNDGYPIILVKSSPSSKYVPLED